jgi:hypothetical protein
MPFFLSFDFISLYLLLTSKEHNIAVVVDILEDPLHTIFVSILTNSFQGPEVSILSDIIPQTDPNKNMRVIVKLLTTSNSA